MHMPCLHHQFKHRATSAWPTRFLSVFWLLTQVIPFYLKSLVDARSKLVDTATTHGDEFGHIKRSKLFKSALKKSVFMLQKHGIRVNAGAQSAPTAGGAGGGSAAAVSETVRRAAARSGMSPRHNTPGNSRSPHARMLAPNHQHRGGGDGGGETAGVGGSYANIHMSSVQDGGGGESFGGGMRDGASNNHYSGSGGGDARRNRPISAQDYVADAGLAAKRSEAAGPRPNTMPAHLQMMYNQTDGPASFRDSIDPDLDASLKTAEKRLVSGGVMGGRIFRLVAHTQACTFGAGSRFSCAWCADSLC